MKPQTLKPASASVKTKALNPEPETASARVETLIRRSKKKP